MQTIHSCPTAVTTQPTPSTYHVIPPTLPTPAAPYSVAYVAEAAAPALTLQSVRAALLPLAEACGFADVTLTEELNSHGSAFTGHALCAISNSQFRAEPLTRYPYCTSLAELLEVSSNALTELQVANIC